jgi:hypothetical protein
MAKLTLTDLANLESQTTAVQAINNNNALTEAALENTLSRDGTSPNSMNADLDMNSKRILNLPAPLTNTEPVRLGDIGGLTGLSVTSLATMAGYASAAAASAAAAASYVGSATQAPKWTTGRTITLSGAISGTSPSWDGTTNLAFSGITVNAGAVTSSHLAVGAAVGNIGYNPANLAGATFTGEVRLNYTPTSLNTDSVGFRGIPVNTQDANYTFTVADGGKMVRHTDVTARAYTINPVASTAYPVGHTIIIRNVGSGIVTLTRGGGVSLRKAGSSTDANVAVAQWGMATLVHEATDVWVVTGSGIT